MDKTAPQSITTERRCDITMVQINLHNYQEVAKKFLVKTPKAGLFLDVGFGKTLTTLAALMELARIGKLHGHILIVAPKAIARSTWLDEMDKWGIQANTVSLIVNDRGKQLTRKKRLERYADIESHDPAFYFINRELICDLINWHIDNKKKWPFRNVIVDELQSFKSFRAARFKALKMVMPVTERFIGLTGTPVPNGLEDLWAEICLMDNGKRLGKDITAYRREFFTPGLVIDNNVVRWDIRPGAENEIYRRIKDLVISIRNPDLKLPPVIYNDVNVYMDPDEQKIYKELLKEKVVDLVDKFGDEITVKAVNSAVLKAKLKQMASGTIYTDENHNYKVIHQHKLEHLEYIINNTTSPVLVAYHFVSDQKEITKYLTDAGITVKTFDGSPEMIREWNAGNIPVMLLQPQSCGHGINIQDGGHTIVWYTVPDSLESYIQVNGRLHRQGQKNSVVIHHLLTSGTVDKGLLRSIDHKDEEEQALLDAVAVAFD